MRRKQKFGKPESPVLLCSSVERGELSHKFSSRLQTQGGNVWGELKGETKEARTENETVEISDLHRKRESVCGWKSGRERRREIERQKGVKRREEKRRRKKRRRSLRYMAWDGVEGHNMPCAHL
jgi:hypothetical protein